MIIYRSEKGVSDLLYDNAGPHVGLAIRKTGSDSDRNALNRNVYYGQFITQTWFDLIWFHTGWPGLILCFTMNPYKVHV